MDKLVVFKESDKSFRECVSCGYHQEMKFSPAFKPLPTRLDLAKKKAKDEEPQEIIRIVTPDSNC
jgi:Zn ribbon nucleic-acid-binding protein